MKKIRMLNIIYSECMRIFKQPIIWIAIVGIAIIRFVTGFSGPDVCKLIFEFGIKEESLLCIDYMWGRASFLSYGAFGLAALPVVGNYLEDYKSGRLSMVLTRLGKRQYVFMRIIMVVLIVSICMFMGNIIYMLAGHYLIGLPYASERENMVNSNLLADGQMFAFWFVTEVQNCMQASFYAFISLGLSLFIKDSQFIIVLPMILRYFFVFLWNELNISWLPTWLSPRAIYLHNNGIFTGNDIAQCLYSVVFTICIAISVAWLLYIRMRKEL